MAETYVDGKTGAEYRIIGRLPDEGDGWESYVGRCRKFQRDTILHVRSGPEPRYDVKEIEGYEGMQRTSVGGGKEYLPPPVQRQLDEQEVRG